MWNTRRFGNIREFSPGLSLCHLNTAFHITGCIYVLIQLLTITCSQYLHHAGRLIPNKI